MLLLLLIGVPFICALGAFLPLSNRVRGKLLGYVCFAHTALTAFFWKSLPPAEMNGFLVLDSLGLLLLSVVSLLFLAVSVYMFGYFEHEQRKNRTFIVCLLCLLSTMTLVSVSYHMGLLWMAVATTTLFCSPLISFHRTQQSLEATWKYLLVCSVGIALALLGTFFLAIAGHEAHTLLLPVLLKQSGSLSTAWLKLSVIFLLVGFGCKMGLAPMHSWKPEAYGQATGMAAMLMAGLVTQCAFVAIVRVGQICAKTGLYDFYASILMVMGVLSLIVAAVFILSERNIKRAFAYSSVEHMGILVLGLAFGGPGVFGALFHMLNNGLAKAVMFLTAGSVAQKYGSSRVDDVRGVIHVYPLTGALLIAGFLAGTGMFPFATFHSEILVINAAVISRHFGLAAVSVICLAIMFIGIGRIVLEMALGNPAKPMLAPKENARMNGAIIAAAILLIGIGLWMPHFFRKVIQNAAAMLGV
ncbi:MAG: proton-conducting transporter membrane subunit [Candidatus Omnitrophica bacterium]|nr:proton-conducting transporter membrane subunit [Candidatus Omnitrophota bacterium]